MKLLCNENVVVKGTTVYQAGEAYRGCEIIEDGKLTSYEVRSNYGVGVWMIDDPTFTKYFTKLNYKVFKVQLTNKIEIVAAKNMKEATDYFLNKNQDETSEINEFSISEIVGEELIQKHTVYSDDNFEDEGYVSYEDLAEINYCGHPINLTIL